MATTVRAVRKNNSTTGTAISITTPTGTTTGDFVVCIIHGNGQTTIADNNGSTPFTADVSDYKPNSTSGHTIAIFSRVIQAGDPSTYNFTMGASNRWAINCMTFQNPNTTSQYDVAPSTANIANVDDSASGTLNAPSISLNYANSIHVVFEVVDTASTAIFTLPTGYTVMSTATNQPTYNAYKLYTSSGATGAVTMISDQFGSRMSGSFAIRDVSAGGTDVTVSPTVLNATFAVVTPTITVTANPTISPTILNATFTVIDPTVTTGAASPGGSVYSSNLSCGLITNSSFELDFTGWDADSGWSRSATKAHTGAISAQINASSGFANLNTTNDATGIAVTANTYYDISFWVNTSVVSGTGLFYQINVGSAFGTPILSGQILNTSGVWQKITGQFFTGSDTKVWIRFYNNNSNIVGYIDDICMSASRVAETAPIRKHYYYKVYTANVYKATWTKEVISEPSFRSNINGGASSVTVSLARPFDNFGEDVDVKLNNRVDVYCVDRDAPNGILIYSGYISGYTAKVSDTSENIDVTLFPYYQELSRMILRDASNNTTLTYSSYDPADILTDVIDKYRSLGGTIQYQAGTIAKTNTTVTYTFNTNTIKECLDKVIELCPIGWFYYVDPNNVIYLQPRNIFADHAFALGLEVKQLETFRRVEDLVNRVLFTGAGAPALFKMYENTSSQATYGMYEKKIVDERVSVAATASVISNREIDQKKDPEIRSRYTIVDNNGRNSRGYNIESIRPGQTLKIKNLKADVQSSSAWDSSSWDVDVWDQTLQTSAADVIQILSIDYSADTIILEASSRLPQISKRIEDIQRNLENSQTVNNPTAPS